ncbi:proteoglycan 4 precursor [Silurus meridionalis]|nr:proteoglycan 4 precursor [Silurus meridionalis]
MSSSTSLLLFSACVLLACSSAQRSCSNRCGEAYFRGNACQCDYECLSHKECCKGYEDACTSRGSCKGRCGESFKRGRQCHCDIECIKYNQCCPDYESHCNTEESSIEDDDYLEGTTLLDYTQTEDAKSGSKPSPSDVAELSDRHENLPGLGTVPSLIEDPELPQVNFKPEQISPNSSETTLTTSPTHPMPASQQNVELSKEPQNTDAPAYLEITKTPPSVLELEEFSNSTSLPTDRLRSASIRPSTPPTANYFSTSPTAQADNPYPTPTKPIQSEDTQDPESPPEAQFHQSNTTTLETMGTVLTDKPSGAEELETQNGNQDTKDVLSTKGSPTPPTLIESTPTAVTTSPFPTKPQDYKLNLQDPQDYQADTNSDTNLCHGSPVNGLTTLRNGTVVVFRGHYFWMLDSRRNAGPAHSIVDFWGIPSPIDTVFTRCNCQGKTYIFKGDKYWRFENDLMDTGFPRPISEGFGLGGRIVAALSMPQYRSRRESVLFFKKGGLAQRYTYLNTPHCGSKSTAIIVKKRFKKEAVPVLGAEIVINKTWVGFPSTVTSAVSVRATGGDGYKYYVFSLTKYYSLKLEGNTPVILTPKAGRENQKSAKSWFKCQETSQFK